MLTIDILINISREIWRLLAEMSFYLLLGFGIAGLLHVFVPQEKIYKHLSGNDMASVIKASLFGVPLPLCSCGVIPVAAHLQRQGAGKGAVLSFLISTPTTGIDSIFATYALLGPIFAIIRPISAFFGGILAGILAIKTSKNDDTLQEKHTTKTSKSCCSIEEKGIKLTTKMKIALKYGFIDLIEDTSKWLIIGIVVGGIISFGLPKELTTQYLGNPITAYTAMLVVGIPLYVCATGSIPIASSLILKGMAPGAGLVFLITGPATNTATISFILGKLGKKTVTIYLIAITITAIIFGALIDYIWYITGQNTTIFTGKMKMLNPFTKNVSATILLALIIYSKLKKIKLHKSIKDKDNWDIILKVPEVSCHKCEKTIKKALSLIKEIKEVEVNLKEKTVKIKGNAEISKVIEILNKAGYTKIQTERGEKDDRHNHHHI